MPIISADLFLALFAFSACGEGCGGGVQRLEPRLPAVINTNIQLHRSLGSQQFLHRVKAQKNTKKSRLIVATLDGSLNQKLIAC